MTTEPNAVVAPIHPKAMPVILTTRAEIERWLTVPAKEALQLQRPLPDDALRIVARGKTQDGPDRRSSAQIPQLRFQSRPTRSCAVRHGNPDTFAGSRPETQRNYIREVGPLATFLRQPA